MRLPTQARPVSRQTSFARADGRVTPSDCCGSGSCCLGACLFGSCIGLCVPNIGQC